MQAQAVAQIFSIIVLIISIVIHEFAHGYSAYLLGDDTARLSGRLTLNPIKHLDPFGSVILPLFLVLSGSGFVIGWARPVPYNPNNLQKGRMGEFIVAFSGIAANLFVAIIFGLLIRIAPMIGIQALTSSGVISPFYDIASIIVQVNLILAIFNIIPIPPLDGSKVLFAFIPPKYRNIQNFMEKWGLFLLVIFIIFIWKSVSPLIFSLFSLLTGLA